MPYHPPPIIGIITVNKVNGDWSTISYILTVEQNIKTILFQSIQCLKCNNNIIYQILHTCNIFCKYGTGNKHLSLISVHKNENII